MARGVTLEVRVIANGAVYDRTMFSLDDCGEGDTLCIEGTVDLPSGKQTGVTATLTGGNLYQRVIASSDIFASPEKVRCRQ